MSIPYANIWKAFLAKTNQLADAIDASAFDSVYNASTIVSAHSGMDIPRSEVKRLILAAEKRVASACVRQKNPILWGELFGKSSAISSGISIPNTDDDNDEWLGTFQTVRDGTTGTVLTEKPKQEIERMNRLVASGFLRIRPFHHAIEGKTLFHTRSTAYFEGGAWDRSVQSAAFEINGTSPLAQECEAWWIAESLAMASGENWYVQESTAMASFAKACEADALRGVVPSSILPDSTANEDPVKN